MKVEIPSPDLKDLALMVECADADYASARNLSREIQG